MKPEFFNSLPTDRLIMDYKPGVTNVPRGGSPDPFIYIDHDLEQNTVLECEHHNVYVDGKLGENTLIRVRNGIVSAVSLGKDAAVYSGMALVISDAAQSRDSKNTTFIHPKIIVVPEEKRAEVFSFLVKNFDRNHDIFEGEEFENTKEIIRKTFPGVSIRFTTGTGLKLTTPRRELGQ